MANTRDNAGPGERDMTNNRLEGQSSVPGDLPDSTEDRKRLQSEETTIDLPDVKDIPGQEFVNAPPLGALGDTTISSDDEEGVAVFDLDDDEDPTEGTDFDVRKDEKEALADSEYLPTADEDLLRRAKLDNTDFQGEELNEKGFGLGEEISGADLDMNDMPDETNTDAMGQGDEENKIHSLGSAENDNVVEGTP